MDDKTRNEREAAVFRGLVVHLQRRSDVQRRLGKWKRSKNQATARLCQQASEAGAEVLFCMTR